MWLRVPRPRAPTFWSPLRRGMQAVRRRTNPQVLLLAGWSITAGFAAADAAYVRENSSLAFASVLVGIVTMAPIGLLLLRVPPLLAWAVSMVSAVGYPLLDTSFIATVPWTPLQLIVGGVVLVAVGWRYRPLVLVGVLVGTVIGLSIGSIGTAPEAPVPGVAFGAAVALVVGRLAGARRRADRRASEREEQLAEESSRRVVLEERARIARELHDVVAHHMSVIAVQAETAPYRVGRLSADARDAFDSIASDARAGLTEMRRLLGVLRSDASQSGALTQPQPTLDDLDALVESARRAGADAELITTGELGQPSAALGLTVYRLVQESLSNAVQHAPGAHVLIQVSRSGDALHVSVRNDTPTRLPDTTSPAADGGHGLAGMRERVALLEGTLATSREPHGGFLVEATLPYETSATGAGGAQP